MSNSNYSIGLQRLKPVHTAYCGLHNLAENWSWARDVNGRDRDETSVRLETVSRTRRRDRDQNPAYICSFYSVHETVRYQVHVNCERRDRQGRAYRHESPSRRTRNELPLLTHGAASLLSDVITIRCLFLSLIGSI